MVHTLTNRISQNVLQCSRALKSEPIDQFRDASRCLLFFFNLKCRWDEVGIATVHKPFCRRTWRRQNIYWKSDLSNLCLYHLVGSESPLQRSRKNQETSISQQSSICCLLKRDEILNGCDSTNGWYWRPINLQPLIESYIRRPGSAWFTVYVYLMQNLIFWQKLDILNPNTAPLEVAKSIKETKPIQNSKTQNPKSKIKTPKSKLRILDFGRANLKLSFDLEGFQALNH